MLVPVPLVGMTAAVVSAPPPAAAPGCAATPPPDFGSSSPCDSWSPTLSPGTPPPSSAENSVSAAGSSAAGANHFHNDSEQMRVPSSSAALVGMDTNYSAQTKPNSASGCAEGIPAGICEHPLSLAVTPLARAIYPVPEARAGAAPR